MIWRLVYGILNLHVNSNLKSRSEITPYGMLMDLVKRIVEEQFFKSNLRRRQINLWLNTPRNSNYQAVFLCFYHTGMWTRIHLPRHRENVHQYHCRRPYNIRQPSYHSLTNNHRPWTHHRHNHHHHHHHYRTICWNDRYNNLHKDMQTNENIVICPSYFAVGSIEHRSAQYDFNIIMFLFIWS